MEVQGQTSRKRPAESLPEELPSAKRTKFSEFFCGVFSSIESVDINTLKIQNRELVSKLTERKQEFQQVSNALQTAEQTQLQQSKNLLSLATFINKALDDIRSLLSFLATPTSEINAPHALDLSKILLTSLKTDSNDAEFSEVRTALIGHFTAIANALQHQLEENNKIASLFHSSNLPEASKSEIEKLNREIIGLRKRAESSISNENILKSQISALKEDIEVYVLNLGKKTEENIELRGRFERLARHVARVEHELASLSDQQSQSLHSSSNIPSSTSSVKMDTSGQLKPDNSDPAISALQQENSALLRELEESKRLVESRLVEIQTLRTEKIELLKSNQNQVLDFSKFSNSDLEQFSQYKHLQDCKTLLESQLQSQKEKVSSLLAENEELKANFEKAKQNLMQEFQRQGTALQTNIDNMTTKLKNMEQDRDKAKHRLAVAEAKKTPLDSEQIRHFTFMESQLKESKDMIDTLKNDQKTLKSQYDKLLADMEQNEMNKKIVQLEERISLFKNQMSQLIGKLESNGVDVSEFTKYLGSQSTDDSHSDQMKLDEASASSSKSSDFSNKIFEISEAKARLDLSQQQLKDAKETISSQVEQIKQLSNAIDDLVNQSIAANEENQKLASLVAERDHKIDQLTKEKINAAAFSSMTKKQLSIENEHAKALQSESTQLGLALESERSSNQLLNQEIVRLNKEITILRSTNEKNGEINSQTAIAMNLLTKRIAELEAIVTKKDALLSEYKGNVEEEKALRARLDEELGASKRMVNNLKSSQSLSLTSSIGIDGDSRYKKDLQLYQARFNCSLCDKARRVDSIISICGHAFCGTCIEEKCIKPRNRKCPKCKKTFGQADVGPIFF